jgi:hypothetical protein
MQVIASLDESDVGRIRPGQFVRFRVDAFPNEEFRGAVTQVRLQPTTVQNVVTYQTVIDVPNPELKLKPGMTANVNIEIARRQNVLRVPNPALRFRPTTEMFTALGQTPPPTGGGRGRGTGAAPDTRNAQPGQQPMAQQQSGGPVAQGFSPANDNQQPAGQRAARQRAATSQQASPQGSPQDGRTASGGNQEQAADSRSGRGGGGGRRGDFQERLASMTPEERERVLERMRARGFTPPADGAPAPASQPSRGQGARSAGQTAASKPATGQTAPATFDALFGPLPPSETFGQVWLNVGGKLQRVRLRLGVSDGQQTELIQAIDGTLDEGSEVVTNVTTGAVRQTTPAGGNAFPGLGGGRGFGGGRGGRGGG